MKTIPQVLSLERLRSLLAAMPVLKIAVLGDIALDAYWHADMTRAYLSRETPLFPRPVVQEAYAPGAGGNVAQNLKALGAGQVTLFTVVGQDHWADLLDATLLRNGIRSAEILHAPGRRTTTYIKPVLMGYNSRQEDARLDFENASPLSPVVEAELLSRLERGLPELDAVIIADQLEINGVVSERVRRRLSQLAEAHPQKIFLVDSRQRIGQYRGCALKPNWIEAVRASDPGRSIPAAPPDDLPAIGLELCRVSRRPVFITLSEGGALACTSSEQEHILAAPVTPPLDPVGAGDAFQAALAASLCAGASPWEAAALANLAAGVTVEKLQQTGTASPQEIITRFARAEAGAEV